jgi:hypothetical protein
MTSVTVEVKFTLEQATKDQMGRWGTVPLTSALDGVNGQHYSPAVLPPGNIGCSLYRRLVGPQGRSGQVRKILPPLGFDPRTIQPVTIRYTDWAIRAQIWPGCGMQNYRFFLGLLDLIYCNIYCDTCFINTDFFYV